MSLATGLNELMWPNSPTERIKRSDQHVKSCCLPRAYLFFWRLIASVLMWSLLIWQSIDHFRESGFFKFQFFSVWGVWATTFTFTLLLMCHLLCANRYSSNSLFNWWKVASFLFQTIMLWNALITLVRWGIMFPKLSLE